MSDLKANQQKLEKLQKKYEDIGNCNKYDSQKLDCVLRKARMRTSMKTLEKKIAAAKAAAKPAPAKPAPAKPAPASPKAKGVRGRPPMDCSKLDKKVSERKTEKGKKTVLKKCSDRASHPTKPCVVKNNKCVTK
jgi:hypothetical protein